jgi:hypothetical protein
VDSIGAGIGAFSMVPETAFPDDDCDFICSVAQDSDDATKLVGFSRARSKSRCIRKKRCIIAKQRNTAAKRQRENDKRQKAVDKRAKRAAKKDMQASTPYSGKPDEPMPTLEKERGQ